MSNIGAKNSHGKPRIGALNLIAASLVMACNAGTALADNKDPALLGTKLTPAGAEVGAGANGTIPAWSKPEAQGPGWSYGKVRGEHWKYRNDKPLYSIDESNLQTHANKLAPGQVELFKKIKGFRMDVYPTRRSCGMPEQVAENTRKNVGFAKLSSDGTSLQEAYVPGIPFPMPASGEEAMWNMKMRYRGVMFEQAKTVTAVSPRKGASDWLVVNADVTTLYPWSNRDAKLFSAVDRVENYYYYDYLAPASLVGQAGVSKLRAGEAAETFTYFPGQRRVRRMPSYAYDAPQIGFDNQYTVDELFVFSGNIDRFDWKLVGKKELIVPYNAFGIYDSKAKFDDVVQRDFVAPSHRRYEIHRVWEVEATIKSGMRHVAPKRVYYLDEDSWSPLLAVDYDAKGRVWKVREGFLIPVYETGSCDVQAQSQYNLVDGRYLVDGASIGTGNEPRWYAESPNTPRTKRDFYTSDNLRAVSDR